MGIWKSFLNQWAALGAHKSSAKEFSQVFEARHAIFEERFGVSDELLSPRPGFQFGGEAAVSSYPNFIDDAVLYITEELTGYPGVVTQAGEFYSGYELAMLQPANEVANPLNGSWIISQFARSTINEEYGPGHTADIRATDGPPIDGLIFTTLDGDASSFELDGKSYGILLAVGIKADELEFAYREGSDALLNLLRDKHVLPYTIVNRPSVV